MTPAPLWIQILSEAVGWLAVVGTALSLVLIVMKLSGSRTLAATARSPVGGADRKTLGRRLALREPGTADAVRAAIRNLEEISGQGRRNAQLADETRRILEKLLREDRVEATWR